MQHFKLRCKHCQREYTYCTYGNGPEYGTEAGCSMEYCSECQTAIDKALGKIKVKFKAVPVEINEPRLFALFDKIRAKHDKEKAEEMKNGTYFPDAIKIGADDAGENYDEYEIIYHNGKRFQVGWNDDAPDNKHVHIWLEYDIAKKQSTGKPWEYNKNEVYYCRRNILKDWMKKYSNMSSTLIETNELEKPIGSLFFLEPNHEFDTTNKPIITKPKEHVLKTWSMTHTGDVLKSRVKNAFHETTVSLGEGVSIDGLFDFIDYKCTYEQYDDEDVVKLVKIECI